MTGQQRDQLRAMQDRLIELAYRCGYRGDTQLSYEHPGSPTIAKMSIYLYTDWEPIIRQQLRTLEQRTRAEAQS